MRTHSIEPLEARIAPATIALASQNVPEGDADKIYQFVVTLDAPATAGTTVDYAITAGTAVASDFEAATGTATFAEGSQTATIPITIHGNTTPEHDRDINVTLSNAMNATLPSTGSAKLTILDDDHFANFASASVTQSIQEGNQGSTNLTYTVNLDSAVDHAVTVHYATQDGTATSSGPMADFKNTAGDLTFGPGETTKTFTVPVIGDTVAGPDETFQVNLTVPDGTAKVGPAAQATSTIMNDDGTPTVPTVNISDAVALEGTNAVFTVSLSAPSESDVSVHYKTAPTSGANAATAGADYTAVTDNVLTFHGTTSQTISIPLTPDQLTEGNETFQVQLSNPSGATLGAHAQATGTIMDPAFSLSASDVQVPEGNEGISTAVFVVSVNEPIPAGATLTVDYATSDLAPGSGHATAGSDYDSTIGHLTFDASSMTKTVAVNIHGDQVLEANETFALGFSNAQLSFGTNTPGLATLTGKTSVTGTILNDENPQVVVSVTAAAATLPEGDTSSTPPAHFTVSLSEMLDHSVDIHYTIAGQTAPGVVTIPAYTLSAPVDVAFNHDTVVSHDQVLTVNLSPIAAPPNPNPNPETLVLSNTAKTATTTVLDDDARLVLTTKSAAPFLEGNSGTKPFVFQVSLIDQNGNPATVDHPVTVNFASADGTGPNGATSTGTAADFDAVAGAITLPAGQSTEVINVNVHGDTLPGVDENFSMVLSNPVGAKLGTANATATIVNDDTPVTLPVVTVANGIGAAGGNVTFTVTLSSAFDSPVDFQYATTDGTAVSTGSGADFSAVNAATLTIAPGQTTATISIPANAETQNDDAESFTVHLSSPHNASLGTTSAVGTIQAANQPTLSVASQALLEGNSGSSPMTFTAQLSAATDRDVTFTVDTADFAAGPNAATAGTDYVPLHQTVTILAGQTQATFAVTVNGDTAVEADESFAVNLSNIAGAQGAGGTNALSTSGKILNDDTHFSVVSADPNGAVSEGAGVATFTIQRDGTDFSQPASVHYSTVDGTATDGTAAVSSGLAPDFTAKSGVANFAVGASTATITVPILKDNHHELSQSFSLMLDSSAQHPSVNGVINPAKAAATVTILDNDPIPTVSLTNPSIVLEGDSGTSDMIFTVALDRANDAAPVTLNYATMDGTAKSGSDYQAANGSVTFAPGEVAKTITVKVINDTLYDSARYESVGLNVTLATAAQATLGSGVSALHGLGYIQDNDSVPVISVANATLAEGSQSDGFTVSLSHGSDTPISIQYFTRDLNATSAGASPDYARTAGTLVFNPGETSKVVAVPTVADHLTEGNEYLTFNLLNPTGAILSPTGALAYGLIADADHAAITINDVHIVEGDSGLKNAVFTVSVAGKTAQPITLNYTTADGTGPAAATAGTDFVPTSGTLVIASQLGDSSSATITVPIIGGLGQEADETFNVQLSNPSLGTLIKSVGVGTILNGNHTLPELTIDNPIIVDGIHPAGQDGQLNFTVSLAQPATQAVTFTANTESIVATSHVAVAGTDYTPLVNQTFIIPIGATSTTVSVPIKDTGSFKLTEFFNVRLSNVQNAAADQPVGTGTIYDNHLYVSGQTAAWTDVDGDLAVLTVSQGTLTSDMLLFHPDGSSTIQYSAMGGRQLYTLDLASAGQMFAKANVTLAAYQQPDAKGHLTGDNRVNLGYLRANDLLNVSTALDTKGVDLGTVLIDGDLARIDAGDLFSDPAVSFLGVQSFGVKAATTDPSYNPNAVGVSNLLAGASWIYSNGDVQAAIRAEGQASGSIGRLNIGGTLQGGALNHSGSINVSGTLGYTTIHAIAGGAGDFSGALSSSTGAFGPITIQGSITGGTGNQSGSIVAPAIYSISVGDSIHGALISADNALGTITVAHDVDQNSFIVGGGVTNNIAFYSVVIHGNVDQASILGGYSSLGKQLNADAQINYVQVDGSVHAFNLVAGAVPSNGGTSFLAAPIDAANVYSRIASVVFNGMILPNTPGDAHYLLAQEIDSLVVDGVAQAVSGTATELESGSGFYAKLVLSNGQ